MNCEHCSCNTAKGKRCCYCHEEPKDQFRLQDFLRGKKEKDDAKDD